MGGKQVALELVKRYPHDYKATADQIVSIKHSQLLSAWLNVANGTKMNF
jgi:hypothetical protein